MGLATGQVRFTSTGYPASGNQAFGIVSGDFNRDGKPDMAVGTNGAVDIFLNLGSGKFGNRVSYAMPGNVSVVRSADMDDALLTSGNLDIFALVDQGGSISTLADNGDGTFRNGAPITLAMPGIGFRLGDVNNDGHVDIVALECNYKIGKCQFEILLGNGQTTFTSRTILALAGTAVSGPVLADVNKDGKLDLINTRDPKVFVWKGNGDGTFATPVSYQPPTVCTDINTCADVLTSVVVGDFNNDGAQDLAVEQAHTCGSACGDNTVYLYKNNGSGSFTRVSSFRGMGSAGGVLSASDLNGDQNIDLINLNGDHFGGGNDYAPGKGNFTFGPQSGLPGGSESADMVVRDLNLDSRHDLAISSWLGGDWSANINTSAFTNCAAPSSANLAAKICGPANNASVTSPVTVKASGNSPAGIQRLEVWIDGAKKYDKWNDQLAKKFTLAAGSHKITVVAVDMYKGTAKTSVTVTVH
jgi:hypothetical protein